MTGDRFAVLIGTRPEAIKLSPVVMALRGRGRAVHIITSGQHPDLLPPIMAELGLEADMAGCASSTLAGMVPNMQAALRRVRPVCTIVQGDTLSAAAGALAAGLEGIPLAHVEAGLRTHNLSAPFPEELLRTGIARLAELHFAPTPLARRNLLAEGVDERVILVTGNTIVDAVRALAPPRRALAEGARRALLTVHRRENDGAGWRRILDAACSLATEDGVEILYPVHPRTPAAALTTSGAARALHCCAPLPYRVFVAALAGADVIITDSGGVQEEAAALGVPCVIARDATERPEVLAGGSAVVAGTDSEAIIAAARHYLAAGTTVLPSTRLGDGRAGERIAAALDARFPATMRVRQQKTSAVNQQSAWPLR